MMQAQRMPVTMSVRVTVNLNTTWAKAPPRVLTLCPLNSTQASAAPMTPPSKDSSIASNIRQQHRECAEANGPQCRNLHAAGGHRRIHAIERPEHRTDGH